MQTSKITRTHNAFNIAWGSRNHDGKQQLARWGIRTPVPRRVRANGTTKDGGVRQNNKGKND